MPPLSVKLSPLPTGLARKTFTAPPWVSMLPLAVKLLFRANPGSGDCTLTLPPWVLSVPGRAIVLPTRVTLPPAGSEIVPLTEPEAP